MRTILCKLSVSCRLHGYLEWQDLWGIMPFSYLRMRKPGFTELTSGVRQVEPGICEIDGGHLSFVMGLIHPVIYLSSGLDPESRKVVFVPTRECICSAGITFSNRQRC